MRGSSFWRARVVGLRRDHCWFCMELAYCVMLLPPDKLLDAVKSRTGPYGGHACMLVPVHGCTCQLL